MIYLDTAALVKLVRREVESDALVDWIAGQPDELLVSSVLAEVELPRALRRTEPALLAAVPGVLGRIAVYEIDELVRTTAAAYDNTAVRSLDAIHLATADAVLGDDLTAFVTYDRRLRAAAEDLGMPVAAPSG
ncbi:type II toxin-antitoxin system VapC family toxin [Streptomyces sp. SID13031]|uniref:type II toxin-antitoxin system VapC family toxin n=1 Tax=Streptomyces sp. SID13031 TaxID=2706046 RepID=UPI0013CB6440|nr:type II toxin-antitoxin system VapC family toxin [Streptomyces sp. SID13031]NEA31795.1 type II toxin-antitoxin system VapC family toxin [Streptomyces sp. SID13031]